MKLEHLKVLLIILASVGLVTATIIIGWSNSPNTAKKSQSISVNIPDNTISLATTNSSKTLYMKSITNVRECPSFDCKVLFTLPSGNATIFPDGYDLSQSWYRITFYTDQDKNGNLKPGPKDIIGYVHQSLFSSQEPARVATKPIFTPSSIAIRETPISIPSVIVGTTPIGVPLPTFFPAPTPIVQTVALTDALNGWRTNTENLRLTLYNNLRSTWDSCLSEYDNGIKAIENETPEQTWQAALDSAQRIANNYELDEWTRVNIGEKLVADITNNKQQYLNDTVWLKSQRDQRTATYRSVYANSCDIAYNAFANYAGLPYTTNISTQSSYVGELIYQNSLYSTYDYYKKQHNYTDPTVTFRDGNYTSTARMSCVNGTDYCGITVTNNLGYSSAYRYSCLGDSCSITRSSY